MRTGTTLLVAMAGCFTLSCDAKVPSTDGRHGAPIRGEWLVRMKAPGKIKAKLERTVSGAALYLLVDGAPGSYRVSTMASGTSCAGPDGNEPIVEVRADDSLAGQWRIVPGPPAEYHADFELTAKPRRLEFRFENDYSTFECDRNVSMDGIDIRESSPEG